MCLGCERLAPGHLLLTPLLQGCSTDGLTGHVQSLKVTQQDSGGAICHCPKPSLSERRRNFKKSEEVIALVTRPSFTQQSLLSPARAILAWGRAFSNYRGSCLVFLLLPQFLWGLRFPTHMLSLTAPADLPPTQPRHAHAFSFSGICHTPDTVPSCFSRLSQRRGSVCPHWFQHLLSPGLLPPPRRELEDTALAKARCHTLNGGDGKKCLTGPAASFSSSLYNLLDLNGH